MGRMTNRSRGFGFVDMDDSDAQKAITGMNGQKWGDRELTVNEAKPRTDSREGGGGGGGRRDFKRY